MLAGSLYFHLPFCTRRCPYCHFYVVRPTAKSKAQLLNSLEIEWSQRKPQWRNLSVYFGGGTPSLMGPEAIATILDWVRDANLDLGEVTLEANPEELTAELIKEFADAGVNRLSIGVQSFDDGLLKTLGRTHDGGQAIDAIESGAKHIPNITIDLMLELPGQTLAQVDASFRQATRLPITHLSLYNLVLEPPSLWHTKREQIIQPDQDLSAAMLDLACHHLESAGLHRYEISAFAKPGLEAIHNSGYWSGRPFLGLGPSAFSYENGTRYRNVASLKVYAEALTNGQDPVDFRETLANEAHQRELLAVGLRLTKGVESPTIARTEIEQLIEQNLLVERGGRLQLTPRGQLFYDEVASTLVAA